MKHMESDVLESVIEENEEDARNQLIHFHTRELEQFYRQLGQTLTLVEQELRSRTESVNSLRPADTGEINIIRGTG